VGAAEQVGREMLAYQVPVVIVAAALPFIAGMVTGAAVGFVGTSFPILLPMITTAYPDESIRPYVALAYAFGHLGQLMSPLHVCHVVSNQYFKTSFGPVYRQLIPAAVPNAVLVIAYFMLLKMLM